MPFSLILDNFMTVLCNVSSTELEQVKWPRNVGLD